MKELEITNDGNLNIDIMELPESCVVVLSNGVAKLVELPAHAETKIVTYKGSVKKVQWAESEDF